jgi:hypothetical protein
MKTKGFATTTAPKIEYQLYHAELKRRYLTDNSELLLGSATIQVPKDLKDRTGETLTKREVWDAFAQAVCYCLISSSAGEEKGVNQIFLFDNRWNLLERLETNVWEENGCTPTYQKPMDDATADVAWEAFKRCQIDVQWLKVPVVA